ncbi:uncharacterized protein LOC122725289 [Manihot esculenta]|uniref:uncharacterized protein LOC122725289 n=1 Tax=Manihot esculenta TaxID=3983 RepID=UPI001CC80CE8|nr:uncharacterized protein LOC122725289 [Manihot esculenta]
MKRAEKYIRQDDALTTSRSAREATDRGKAPKERRSDRPKRRHNKGPEVYRQSWDRREQKPPLSRAPKTITPLNASRVEVLVAVQDKEFFQWPKAMKVEASRRDPDKYCQYHHTHDHDTNDCYHLISEIERLIKRGQLRNFVKKLEGERPQQNPIVERPRRLGAGPVNDGSSRTINMIVGGTRGRMSRRGKKRSRDGEGSNSEVMQVVEHSPMVISFSPEDAHGIQMPYDDALVIKAIIHNYQVRKILVDDESKVNLLSYRVFRKIGIPEEQLVRDQAPVKGIGGTPINVEVKLPLSYNAILGRSVVYDFEVVTSIRYLTMKFPTKARVGVVRWCQDEAWVVYMATVAEPSSVDERINSEVMEVRDEKKEARIEPMGDLETFPLSEGEADSFQPQRRPD